MIKYPRNDIENRNFDNIDRSYQAPVYLRSSDASRVEVVPYSSQFLGDSQSPTIPYKVYIARIPYEDGYAAVYRDDDDYLYKVVPYPPSQVDADGNFIGKKPGSVPTKPKTDNGTIGSTGHSLTKKYRVKVLVSDKYGYVQVKNQDGPLTIANLVYIDKTAVVNITNVIDFPPRFSNGDLQWLEGKHFYSPNDDSFYYYAGSPDIKVSCYFRVYLEQTIRSMKFNDCHYLVVTETVKYKHNELYTVAGLLVDFNKILIFSEIEEHRDNFVIQDSPGDDMPPVPPTHVERKKFKIGPFEFLLPIGEGGLGPNDAEWEDGIGREAAYVRLRELYIRTHARVTQVKLVPTCRQVRSVLKGSKQDTFAYEPVNKYHGRHFYCPANNTFYFYAHNLKTNSAGEYDVAYYHYPKSYESADASLVDSGVYIDAQKFDELMLTFGY